MKRHVKSSVPFLATISAVNRTANIYQEVKSIEILDRKRELEWSEKNKARDNTLIVYKATPEEIEKLKGVSDMGRPLGSKNKKNHSGIEIMPNNNKPDKPLNKRREELAKKLEAEKQEEMHEMNGADVRDLSKMIEEAQKELSGEEPLLFNHNPDNKIATVTEEEATSLLEAFGLSAGPVVESVVVNEYHRTLINKIRAAAYSAYVEEIANLYTGMSADNMVEKMSTIMDITAATLMEVKERGL